MAYIFGPSDHSPQGYRHAHADYVPYPEQIIAANHLLYEEAAIKYWEVVGQTDDRAQGCYAAALIAPTCLFDEDFWHILDKRKPAILNK